MPRKGSKEPNRTAKRNSKNTKAVGRYHLYDTVRFNGEVGDISGFTGSAAYVQNFDGEYLSLPEKTYKQIPLSELELIKHNNDWLAQTAS